jgi:hypothetical protein
VQDLDTPVAHGPDIAVDDPADMQVAAHTTVVVAEPTSAEAAAMRVVAAVTAEAVTGKLQSN